MKFSYRMTGISIVVATLIVLYVTWNDDLITWNSKPTILPNNNLESMNIKDVLNNTNSSSFTGLKMNLNQSCNFASSALTVTNISTLDILQEVMVPDFKTKINNFTNDNNSKKKLKVIVIPHSHNDPGWHKTVDNYFEDQTKLILDNIVEKLTIFPEMTFVWVESVFLSLWWKDLDAEKRNTVKRLIKKKRLEILVGSWVVPDEANCHYFALVDQLILGHQWLEHNLDVKPNNSWALDPFGYSSTHPYLYKRAGFNNMVILRVHEKVKKYLQAQKQLEFFWRQHWDSKATTDIFTQMMPYKLYNIKHTCGPDHSVCLQFDFRKIPGEYSESRAVPISDQNVRRLSKLLVGQYQKKAKLFKQNVLLVPLGDDFRYDRNIEWDQQYKNYKMLFRYMNLKKDFNIEAKFGTVQDYFNALAESVSDGSSWNTFPVLSGDFFPYTDQNDEYWAGYFTTRPFDKNLGRELEVNLRAADILNSLATVASIEKKIWYQDYEQNFISLTEAHEHLGLFQHHDAITGTETVFVAMDYERRLKSGIVLAQQVMNSAATFLLNKENLSANQGGHSDKIYLELDEPSSLKLLGSRQKIVHVSRKPVEVFFFNSVAHAREEIIRLSVDTELVDVMNSEAVVTSQINPVWTSASEFSNSTFELLFTVRLPPLGIAAYTLVKKLETSSKSYPSYIRLYNTNNYRVPQNVPFNIMPPGGGPIVLENDDYRVKYSPISGNLQTVTTKSIIKTNKVNMEFLMYKSQTSGAYIFDPLGPAVDSEFKNNPSIRVVRGPLVSEIHIIQTVVTSIMRLYNCSGIQGKALEIHNVVDIRNMNDKEIIMRFSTDIKNKNNTFYTDLNGFQIMKRHYYPKLRAQANYYPMTTVAYLEDEDSRFSILSAQPLGVSSQSQGSLEVMLDRRLMYDDNRGLGEGVKDNKRTPSRFYLLLERKTSTHATNSEKKIHAQQMESSFPSLLSHSLSNHQRNYIFIFNSRTEKNANLLKSYSPMLEGLPCDILLVNLLAMKPSGDQNVRNALILHRLGVTCDFGLACAPSDGRLSLHSIFKDWNVIEAMEMTLSLMYEKTEIHQKENVYLKPMELYVYRFLFHSELYVKKQKSIE